MPVQVPSCFNQRNFIKYFHILEGNSSLIPFPENFCVCPHSFSCELYDSQIPVEIMRDYVEFVCQFGACHLGIDGTESS